MNLKIIFASILILFNFFSCQNPKDDSIEIVNELLEEMEQAYNDGDLRKVANFYSDDAQLLAPGGYKVAGRKAVDEYWMKLKPVRWELTPAKTAHNEDELYETEYWKKLKQKPPHWKEHEIKIEEDENIVYQLGHSKLQYENEDNTVRTSHVDFILVWRKMENEEYKVFIDTYASN